jgi:TolA-binding protein
MKMKSIFSGMNPIRRFPASPLVAGCALLLGSLSLCAQAPAAPQKSPPPTPTVAVSFKDGKSVATTTLRRSGDNLLVTVPVGETMGEVAYPISNIAKVDFPEPAQIQSTTTLILRGSDEAAIAQIDPIIIYYDTYKDVPGNWWAAASRLKLMALRDLHRDAEADALIDDMVKSTPPDSDAGRMASVFQAASTLAAKGQHDKAIAVYDDVIKASTDEDTLATAWVNKANSLYALQKFDPALLAYLHVPVFYPSQKLLMPAVLIGSGKCYVHIENLPEAENSYNDLIKQFPSSPQAAAAKAELKKIIKPEETPTPTPAAAPDSTPAPASPAATPAATPATSPATTPAKQ